VTGGTGLEGRVEFRILGPLEVLSDGQALDLGGAKQRALLAMLLLNANEVVSTDRLIDALWDENPPESAQKALQVHVSNLRKVLGKERLQTKTPGYLLRAEEHELDVKRFSELRASGQLDEALALWRGPPLADLGYQRPAWRSFGSPASRSASSATWRTDDMPSSPASSKRSRRRTRCVNGSAAS
jgi:DNA-binding SARP family transcriptional activator